MVAVTKGRIFWGHAPKFIAWLLLWNVPPLIPRSTPAFSTTWHLIASLYGFLENGAKELFQTINDSRHEDTITPLYLLFFFAFLCETS